MIRVNKMATMTGLDARSVFRRSAEVVCRQVGPESVLVPIRQNVGNLDYVYTLSAVAARIWTLLDGKRSLGDIAAELCAEFDVDRETALADISELVSDLDGVALVSQVTGT